MEEVTSEEFNEWKNHPVTKAFFEKVREQREGVAEQVLSGRFVGTGPDQDKMVLAVAIYDQVLDTEFEE